MTDTNQKLREALQAISHIDDTTNHSVDASAALDHIGQIARQALALPTADHLPDAGEMVVDHFPDATKMIETAAPVGDREAFEREMRCEEEWGHRSLKKRQNGQYENWQVDLMWAVWQARAALPTAAPVGERLTLSAEDVHAAFVKHFPKTRISQAWIGFAAEIAEAMQARAALSARKPLTSEQVKALKGEYGYSLAPVQAQADFINGIRCGEKAHGIDAAMRKDKP